MEDRNDISSKEKHFALDKLRSIRSFKSEKIPENVVRNILEVGRHTSTAHNIQPWHFVVIKDPEMKKKVAKVSRGQHWMANADVIVCGCALMDIVWSRMGGYMTSFAVDITIAMDHMILAAANEGLGTCWIGAFDEKQVKEILQVPENVHVVALTPIGYPGQEPKDRGRKTLSEIISYEKFER